MWYRLSYSHNDISDTKELATSQDLIELYAQELIEKHNNVGTVVIERRPSEYYGTYKHILTISEGLDSYISVNNDKLSMGPTPASRINRRYVKDLCVFKQIKLDEEPQELRKLMWICDCKSASLKDSDTYKMLKNLQNEQIKLIEKSGKTYEEIVEFARFYEFIDAMVLY